jgi:hypothetical protein
MHQNREAYFIAGSGSATDNVKQAARVKMTTTVETLARIISSIANVVEI